jgi:hypothetical protein
MIADYLHAARRALVGVGLGLALFATPASADTVSLTLTADPNDGTLNTIVLPGQTIYVYDLFMPVEEFTIASGDTVDLDLTLTSLLTVPAGDQFVGFNLEPRDPAGATDIEATGTMQFSGPDAPVGVLPAGFSGLFSLVIFQDDAAAFSFDGLLASATWTYTGPPLTFDEVSISFQVTAVPVPAALPLFASGLGLMGFLGHRRKRKAATAVAA